MILYLLKKIIKTGENSYTEFFCGNIRNICIFTAGFHFFTKVIVEFFLSVFLTELFTTILKLAEVFQFFKLLFKEFQEDFEF